MFEDAILRALQARIKVDENNAAGKVACKAQAVARRAESRSGRQFQRSAFS
jgi:hypothetical protein